MVAIEPVPVEPEPVGDTPGLTLLPGGQAVNVTATADQLADGVIFDARPLFGPGGIVQAAPAPPAQYPGGGWTIANQGWWKHTFGLLFAPPPAETRPKVSPAQQTTALQILATAVGGLAAAVKAGVAESFFWYLDALSYADKSVALAISALERSLAANAQGVGNAITNLYGYVTQRFNQAETDARTDLNTWVHALVAADARVESNVASYALGLSNGARTYALGLYEKAEADLGTWVRALVAADSRVEANNAAYTDAQVRKVGDQLGQVQTVLHGEIVNGVGQAETFAVGLVGAAAPRITADVIGQVQPQIDALAAEQDECLTPLCDTVTPNASQLGRLGRLLHNMEGLAIPALLAALVAEAVADPEAAAAEITDALSWTTDVTTELVGAVLG